jgi:hypothetical protein
MGSWSPSGVEKEMRDMGVLVYGGQQRIEFDDRLLAHLQIVIGAKLRRHEGLFLSWREESNSGGGRVTVWVDPSQPLMFRYEDPVPPMINREWLDALTLASNTPRGVVVTEETVHLSNEPDRRGVDRMMSTSKG